MCLPLLVSCIAARGQCADEYITAGMQYALRGRWGCSVPCKMVWESQPKHLSYRDAQAVWHRQAYGFRHNYSCECGSYRTHALIRASLVHSSQVSAPRESGSTTRSTSTSTLARFSWPQWHALAPARLAHMFSTTSVAFLHTNPGAAAWQAHICTQGHA